MGQFGRDLVVRERMKQELRRINDSIAEQLLEDIKNFMTQTGLKYELLNPWRTADAVYAEIQKQKDDRITREDVNAALEILKKRGDIVIERHHQVGDFMTHTIWGKDETVIIDHVYTYPDGSVAYGFYSREAGRHALKNCEVCKACRESVEQRKAMGEHYIGSPGGVLIRL